MEHSILHLGGGETSYKAVTAVSIRDTRVGCWQWRWRKMGGSERYLVESVGLGVSLDVRGEIDVGW